MIVIQELDWSKIVPVLTEAQMLEQTGPPWQTVLLTDPNRWVTTTACLPAGKEGGT